MRDDFKLINASTVTPHLNPLPLSKGRGDRAPAHYDILIASGLNQQSRIITTSRSGSLMDLFAARSSRTCPDVGLPLLALRSNVALEQPQPAPSTPRSHKRLKNQEAADCSLDEEENCVELMVSLTPRE